MTFNQTLGGGRTDWAGIDRFTIASHRPDQFAMTATPTPTDQKAEARLIELKSRHNELTRAIARIKRQSGAPSLELLRLDVRLKRLSDEIDAIENQAFPDIIA